MNTASIVRLSRIPLSLFVALLITLALFTALRNLTEATFVVAAKQATPIKFERVLVDTPPTPKTREKPEKPIIEERIIDVLTNDPITDIKPETTQPPTKLLDGDGSGQYLLPPIESPRGIANNGVDTDVLPLVRIDPIYPTRALTKEIEGWVRVRFNINAAGEVTNPEIVASNPANVFDAEVLKAVVRWRYTPKIEDAVAVERRGIETVLKFALPKE
jgi:periplasmic protein TonB